MATTTSRKGSSGNKSRSSSRKGSGTARMGRAVNQAMEMTRDAAGAVAEKVASMMPAALGGIDLEFDTLADLYVKELRDLYSAEKQLLKALPKMAQAATSRGLKAAFQSHLSETEGHVKRLEQVFEHLNMRPKAVHCKAMEGLITEGDEWIKEDAQPGVKDAGLIAAAQRVEHYEMAGYGCVRTYARLLGHTAEVNLLQSTLDEEGATDKKLTQLAKQINVQAGGAAVKRSTSSNGKGRRAARAR